MKWLLLSGPSNPWQEFDARRGASELQRTHAALGDARTGEQVEHSACVILLSGGKSGIRDLVKEIERSSR